MKNVAILIAILFFSASHAWSQGTNNIPLLGDNAHSFTAESTTGKISFPKDYAGSWKILFSHPADFTPVCSSELLELGAMQNDFNKLGVKLVVLSTDPLESHQNWVKSMETLNYNDKGPVKFNFPLVADPDRSVSKKYGMMHPSTNSTKDVRGVFIIDPQNIVRAIFFYPMSVGRNMDEIKRTLVALQTTDKLGVYTPANWVPGGDVMLPSTKYTSDQTDLAKVNDPDMYQLIWYMTFKKMKE